MTGLLVNESKCWLALCCISAMLVGCGGGGGGDGDTGGNGGATLPALRIDSASVTESNSGTQTLAFDLTLTAAASAAVTVDYASADATALAGEDYEAVNGTLTIPAGATSAQLLATINGDDCFEADETFSMTLRNISANAQLVTASATATIVNDDLRRNLSIADAEVIEGDTGTREMLFTVSLDSASCVATTGNYTSNVVTASDSDFVVETQSVTIPAGSVTVQIPVTINGDTAYESDETLTVNIEDVPADIAIADGEAFGTIRTDDLPPLSISGVEILEGDTVTTTMVFSIDLAGVTNEISFDYATSDITATVADNDYTATSGSIVIPAGETHASIEIDVIGDPTPESHEDLRVTLSNLNGDALLTPGFDFALGTILDDDTTVVVNPTVTVLQQDGGFESDSSPAVFGFYLNTALTGRVQVDYSTSDITATAGVDYTAKSGRVTIPAGSTSVLVEVPVFDDTDIEGHEYFNMELSLVSGSVTLAQPRVTGTVFDDDYVGPVILSATPRTAIFEGDSGAKEVSVFVTLSDAASDVVTVDYATVDATALAGSDYGAVSGTLTFAVGETLKSVAIPVFGDTVIEAHEHFIFALSNPGGTVLFSYDSLMPPVVIIESDDPFAQLTIDNVGTKEGDGGTADLVFTVSIDAPTEGPVSFDYLSSDGGPGYDHDAVAGEDYSPASGSASIAAGTLQTTMSVPILGDTDNEYDERFSVALSNVSQNAEIADGSGVGTIINDDSGPGWGAAQVLDQDGQDNVLPAIAVNANGDAMAVWSTIFGTQYFESSRYSGGWSSHEAIIGSLVSRDFDVSIGGNGESTLAWIFGGARVERHTTATGWSSHLEFDPSSYNDQDWIELAGNEAGAVIAVWKLNTPVAATDHLMFSAYDPATGLWGANGLNSDYLVFEGQFINSPEIAMNDSGAAIVVWSESQLGVRASHRFLDTGTGSWAWSAPVSISNELGCCAGFFAAGNAPQIAMDAAGNGIAVWYDGNGGVGTGAVASLWASRYDAGTDSWSEAILIETTNMDARDPQIVMDPAGNAFVVWMQDNNPDDFWNDTFEIRARRYRNDAATAWSGNWEAEVLVQDSNTRINRFVFNRVSANYPVLHVPALAVDATGNALLAWSQEIDGSFVIRASRYDLSETTPVWSPPEKISDDTWPYAIMPAMGVDAGGNALVVWQAGDTEDFDNGDVSEIWANRYTAP